MDSQQSQSSSPNSYSQSLYNQIYSPVQNDLAQMSLVQTEHSSTLNALSQIDSEMTTNTSVLLSHDNMLSINQQQQQQTNSSGMNTQTYTKDQKPSMSCQEQQNTLDQPIVPSQRTLDQQTCFQQRKIEEQQERVAAAAQQVMAQQMAQQYAMLQQQQATTAAVTPVITSTAIPMMVPCSSQVSQQDTTPHVVPSQMASVSSTTTSSSSSTTQPILHQVKSDNISLHNAIVQQQHRMAFLNDGKPPGLSINTKRFNDSQDSPSILKKKSRRHTFSNSGPPQLNIDTKNLMSNSPQSAMVRSNGFFNFNHVQDQKQPFSALPAMPSSMPFSMPTDFRQQQQQQQQQPLQVPQAPLVTSQPQPVVTAAATATDYENMSREDLIARLVVLENEKTCRAKVENEKMDEQNPLLIDTKMNNNNNNKSDDDDDDSPSTPAESESRTSVNEEEEDEEEEDETKQLDCRWKDCQEKFTKLQKLISHISDDHVGSGKPTYCCEWKDCARNQKPFTKRHKMYNHLRTHTGERPFVCTKPGCGKRFSRPDSLTTHIKTHSNVRPFICQIQGCGKAYYHSRSLKKHEKTHEATPPYSLSSQVPFSNSSNNSTTDYMTATTHSQNSYIVYPSSGMMDVQQQSPLYDSVNQQDFKYLQ